MKERLIVHLLQFLRRNRKSQNPLLLGFSGGVDSKALLYLLLECRKTIPFELHLAHVDHGWRAESKDQARLLAEEANRLHLPFHLHTLSPCHGPNLEDRCRKLRFAFFSSVFSDNQCEALLLAHQADDLVETVLKRVFEGAGLPFLGGMSPVAERERVLIWRPLLTVFKRELRSYLEKRELFPIEDETNSDPRFLRGRLRREILPDLTQRFGKEISSNLCLLSSRAFELQEYLDRKIENLLRQGIRGPLGVCFGRELFLGRERIELRHLLYRICQKEGVVLSREQLGQMLKNLDPLKGRRKGKIGPFYFFVDPQYFFLMKSTIPHFPDPFEIREGIFQWNRWRVEVSSALTFDEEVKKGWQELWTGSSSLVVPQGKYRLALPSSKNHFQELRFHKGWASQRIPFFLHSTVPVLYQDEQPIGEFLSAECSLPRDRLKISLSVLTDERTGSEVPSV